MNKIILATLTLLLALSTAQARFLRVWSYDDLAKEADCVMIVSVAKPTRHTGKKATYWEQEVEHVQTEFDVHGVLKGKYAARTWEFNHLVYASEYLKKKEVMIDGFPFGEFTEAARSYLVFLKQAPDGSLVPVLGVEDLCSFVVLPHDFATSVRIETGFDFSTGQFDVK